MKNEDQKNQIGLEESNTIFTIWKQLKNSIFNVLFVILNQKHDNQQQQSMSGIAFQVGVDYMQMLQFPFHSAISSVWSQNQTFLYYSSQYSNFSLTQLMPVNFSSFLIMLYLLISLIALVIIDIIYVAYSFSKKKFSSTWPLVVMAKVVPLIVTVFFLSIMETLISVVSCNTLQTIPPIQVMQNFPDIVCFEGWHVFHATITLIFAAAFVFISCIVALTIFEPRMTLGKLTARKNSKGQIIFITNKLFCQFIFNFTPFTNNTPYCVMLFILSGYLFVAYNIDQPFYNRNTSKLFRICSSYFFWTNLVLFASNFFSSYGFQGAIILWICGLPFIGISIFYQRKSNVQKLFSSNLKFKSGQQLQDHLQYVLQLILNKDNDKNSYMLLLGYIQKHIQICLQQDCPLKVKKLKLEQNLPQIDNNCKQLIKQILRMFKQGVKKYPDCTKLRLSFAFFYMQQLQNNNKAYEQFTIAQNTSPSFGQQFIIYRFKKIIRQNLEQQEDEQESKDLIDIIRYDNYVSLCQQAMLLSARLHNQFWAQLRQEAPDLKKLNGIGSRITQTATIIKMNFKEIQKINSHVAQVIHNYALYLIFVSQSQSEGKKLLQQSKKIYMQKMQIGQNDMGIFAMKNSKYGDLTNNELAYHSMIKVSVDRDSVGKIIYSNDAFTQLTGYLKQDITDRYIDKIMPAIYQTHHLNAIILWISDQQKLILQKNNQYISNPQKGYVRQKSGFMLPVDYRVSFDVQQNCFLTLIKADSTVYEDHSTRIYITANTKGIVQDISALGYVFFKVQRQQCQNGQLFIQDLGIPFGLENKQIFSKNGLDIQISRVSQLNRLSTFSNQKTAKLKQEDMNKVSRFKDTKLSQKDFRSPQQFNIRAQQLWINANDQQTCEDQGNVENIFQYQNGKRKIGYIYFLQKTKSQALVYQNQYRKNQLNIFQHCIQSLYQQDQIYDYYQDNFQYIKQRKSKILSNLLKQMNNGEALTFKQKVFRNYAQQKHIKTYRYYKEDFIRIYDIQYQADQKNQFIYENNDRCGKNDIVKLQKKHFQKKIKQAINTQIQHIEVTCLRTYSILFVIILITMTAITYFMTVNQFGTIQNYADLNFNRSNDTNFITAALQTAIDNAKLPLKEQDLNRNLIQLESYQLTFDPLIKISCETQSGELSEKYMFQCLNLLQSRIINNLDPKSPSKNMSIAYNNYILSIYPILQSFTYQPKFNVIPIYIIMFVIFVNALVMLVVWIYNIMRIDQKKFDIMIWFLDIPVNYVNYLQAKSNRFLKDYITVKELEQKGLNMDNKSHYCDIYQHRVNNSDQEMDQQNKVRRIIIARHRKVPLLSRFNFSYLNTFWLLFYSMVVVIFLCAQLSYEISSFNFVNQQWQMINKQFLWSSTFSIVQSLQTLGYTSLQNGKSYLNLSDFSYSVQQNFLNTLTKNNLVDGINQLIDKTSSISAIYSQVYYGDVCSLVSSIYDSNNSIGLNHTCSLILDSKLRSGLLTYNSYIVNYQDQDLTDLVIAHKLFVGPALLIIFQQWQNYFTTELASLLTYTSVIVYIFIMSTIIGFAVGWMIYLRNQNTKMNQTIQMLNLIPLQMLPKHRKDTRDFLNWLIQQASKKQHEDQS